MAPMNLEGASDLHQTGEKLKGNYDSLEFDN